MMGRPLVEITGQCHVVADAPFVGVPAVGKQRHPDLQGAESAREVGAQLVEIDAPAGLLLVLERIGGLHGKGVGEMGPVADHDAAPGDGRVEPLVRIEADRIGPLDAVEKRAEGRDQRRRSTVGPVDVEPHPILPADVGDVAERIDGPGPDRPGGADGGDGPPPRLDVGRDGLPESGRFHPLVLVDFDAAHSGVADAEDLGGPIDGVVDLRRCVDGQRRPLANPLGAHVPAGPHGAGHGQTDEIGHGPA